MLSSSHSRIICFDVMSSMLQASICLRVSVFDIMCCRRIVAGHQRRSCANACVGETRSFRALPGDRVVLGRHLSFANHLVVDLCWFPFAIMCVLRGMLFWFVCTSILDCLAVHASATNTYICVRIQASASDLAGLGRFLDDDDPAAKRLVSAVLGAQEHASSQLSKRRRDIL